MQSRVFSPCVCHRTKALVPGPPQACGSTRVCVSSHRQAPRQPHASAAHGGLQTWLPETAKTLESLLLTTERPLGPPSRTSQFPPGLEAASEQVPTLLTSRWLPIHHSPGHPAPPAFGLDLQTSGRASLLSGSRWEALAVGAEGLRGKLSSGSARTETSTLEDSFHRHVHEPSNPHQRLSEQRWQVKVPAPRKSCGWTAGWVRPA